MSRLQAPAIIAITLLAAASGCIGLVGDDTGSDPAQVDPGAIGTGAATGGGLDGFPDEGGGSAVGGGSSVSSGGSGPASGGGPSAGGTGGTGAAAAQPVDCSGIDQNPAYELCDSGSDFCAGVFTNSAGCNAYCAAAGLECVARYGGEPGCNKESVPIACDAQNGHASDWCVCGPSSGGGGTQNCTTDPQNPPAAVEKHYSLASFNPRSSWVLDCRDYAYTAQFAEHEACDSQYSAGSGQGTATFQLTANPGEYDVYIYGRHTINRNPAGARVTVTSAGQTHVEYIDQRDDSSGVTADLHGTYCLSGSVQVVIDSSVSSASDSVERVRLVPAS